MFSTQNCDSKPSDLLTRTTWIDADIALSAIDKGKADGSRSSLWIRLLLQNRFYELGRAIQNNAALVLLFSLVILVFFSVGLRSATTENNVEKLWVEGKF